MENSKLNHKDNKDNNDGFAKAIKFVKEHMRYFVAGTLFVVLVLVLVKCAEPKMRTGGGGAEGTEAVSTVEESYQVDAFAEVNALISQYYTAYAAGDVATLNTLATPISANEQSYISLFSQYVDEYRDIKCYTKSGLDANSYMVSVSIQIKFAGVETTAPGLDFFYVRTNDAGALYIDNLYSQYNLTNQENALDTSVQSLIYEFENATDVIALQNEVENQYQTALEADAGLTEMLQTTIPNAITEWVTLITAQNAQAQGTETPVETPETPAETPEQNTETVPESTETPAATEQLATTDIVNVREQADTSSQRVATLEKGVVVTRTGIEGDWSAITYNGITGYIKNEYLSYDTTAPVADEIAEGGDTNTADSESTGNESVESESADNSGTDEPVVSIAEGTKVTLQESVNVRSGMSETSDKIGTAYAGETVTVVMSYAEGWTKVTWNGKTGYIKSSLLQ